MYVKLMGNGATNTSGSVWGNLFSDIAGLCTGSITSTSQLTNTIVNAPASTITGTGPTADMYRVESLLSSSGSATLTLEKFHYAKGQNSNAFQAKSRIIFYFDATYGFRIRYADNTSANMYPRADSNYYMTSSTDTTVGSWRFIDANSANDLSNANGILSMHMIITDHVLVFQVQTTGTDTVKDYYTFVLPDLEYSPTIDNYAYASNTRYTPQVFTYWLALNGLERPNVALGSASVAHGVYRQNYMDQYGTFRSAPLGQDQAGLATGNWWTSGSVNAPTIDGARVFNRVYQIPVSTGEFTHQLVPIGYTGHQDGTDNLGDPRRGKLMSCYRTTDDIGFTGDIVTNGQQNFRVFRIHKTGSTTMGSAAQNACYAFPENNIPFAA